MIALASDCLLFRMASGETVPLSAEMISVELMGGTADMFDSDFVSHAASAVFHYFKHDLQSKTVTVGEFAGALEKVLRGFVLTAQSSPEPAPASPPPAPAGPVVVSDLRKLACECGKGCELFFFPRLREEMRQGMRGGSRVFRFLGLRACVKQLTGARRWSLRCRSLEEQIVAFLRQCLDAERGSGEVALLVH